MRVLVFGGGAEKSGRLATERKRDLGVRTYLSEAIVGVEEQPGEWEGVTGWSVFLLPTATLRSCFPPVVCCCVFYTALIVRSQDSYAGQHDDKTSSQNTLSSGVILVIFSPLMNKRASVECNACRPKDPTRSIDPKGSETIYR